MKYAPWPKAQCHSTVVMKDAQSTVQQIEEFFSRLLGHPTLLVPSGRAAISLALRANGIHRAHLLAAPRWSSHCVWDTVSHYANPTTSLEAGAQVALPVHKWGHQHTLPAGFNGLIIEDSVDSLFSSPQGLFPNSGSYEVISLPKVLGTFSGGLLICRGKAELDKALAQRQSDPQLVLRQDALKFASLQDESKIKEWYPYDWENFVVGPQGLVDIAEAIKSYAARLEKVQTRFQQVLSSSIRSKLVLNPHQHPDRVPTVLPVRAACSLLPEYHFATDLRGVGGTYEKVLGFPLHYGVSDSDFAAALASLHS